MPAPVYKASPAAAGVVVLHSQKTTQMVSTELVWRFNSVRRSLLTERRASGESEESAD